MDMSSKPEGATHYVEGSSSPWEKRIGDDWFTFNENTGEWWCCSRGTGDGRLTQSMPPVLINSDPTLETMLTEWRDLEARAQAAQAEADALFEHAGQCHGEIVVRLAELGWGAPRGPMVPGEPVVTLDGMDNWLNWRVGDIIRVLDDEGEGEFKVGNTYPIVTFDDGNTTYPIQLKHEDCMWLDRENMQWISRPSTQP